MENKIDEKEQEIIVNEKEQEIIVNEKEQEINENKITEVDEETIKKLLKEAMLKNSNEINQQTEEIKNINEKINELEQLIEPKWQNKKEIIEDKKPSFNAFWTE